MNTNWLLIAALIAVLVLSWIAGRFGATTHLQSPAVTTLLAEKLASDDNLSTKLANSSAVSGAIYGAVDELIEDGSLADAVISSDQLDSFLEDAAMNQQGVAPSETEIAALVGSEVKRVVAKLQPSAGGSSQTQAIARVQRTMRNYEAQLASLATKVEDDESAAVVNSMQGQLFQLQTMIDGLSKDVRCVVANAGGGTRNFLLKERRTTNLAGVDLTVTLGRLRKNVLDSVAISGTDGSAQSSTAVKANVRIGSPFDFEANGRAYNGILTYSQGRWGPDFVGFEITADPLSGNC